MSFTHPVLHVFGLNVLQFSTEQNNFCGDLGKSQRESCISVPTCVQLLGQFLLKCHGPDQFTQAPTHSARLVTSAHIFDEFQDNLI